ncbi:MAG: serine--tRNA ligase [Alphaproteobacteria bacterium]|nr:serine--tRNA ligase [Alphaproteobacteria bacterium]
MFDIRAIRENPEDFDKGWARRGLEAQTPAILKLDEERRAVQTQLQELQAKRNEESQKIGEIKKSGGDAQEQMDAVARMKDEMVALEERERTLAESLNQHLAGLPNILNAQVPDGEDESGNVEVRKWGEIKHKSGPDHGEIGEALGQMDFETAAKMSGARFTLLSGGLARMERALAQFFLDTHTGQHGFTEVSPPLLVRDNALFGTGQLPKFAEDLFRSKETDHWLIPTSEVPLTNIVADSILEEDELNKRFTAFTPCFRSEAGSAGKDTRGMLRQHQFYKVELVSITTPEESQNEHEYMTQCAEKVLQLLELPYRTVVLCSGDTGFGATKTYDIEVWLPGQETYREISSVSNCGDFQARRMKARFKRKGEKNTEFVHTLNGSGVAVGRALIAVIENYYDPADGGVFVPEVLKPYMGGIEKITKS